MKYTMEELFENPPERFENLVGMWQWSFNCVAPTPAEIFLDLIGWSEDELGESLALGKQGWNAGSLGLMELAYLGDALSEWADRPNDASEIIQALIDGQAEQ